MALDVNCQYTKTYCVVTESSFQNLLLSGAYESCKEDIYRQIFLKY